MIDAPTNWEEYWASPDVVVELRLVIWLYGATGSTAQAKLTRYNSDLKSCTLEASAFPNLSVGNTCSACLSFTLVDALDDYQSLACGQRVDFSVRLKLGSSTTTWINQGVYFIDSFDVSGDVDVTVRAYDALYWVGDGPTSRYNCNASTFLSNCPAKMTPVTKTDFTGAEIMYGLGQDGTRLTNSTVGNLWVPAGAADSSFRETLGGIAAMAGGNAVISKLNRLKLLRTDNPPKFSRYSFSDTPLITASGLSYEYNPSTFTGFVKDKVASGNGFHIEAKIPDKFEVTRRMLTYAYCNARMITPYYGANHKAYTTSMAPIELTGAFIDPRYELGDVVQVRAVINNRSQYVKLPIYHYNVDYVGGCWGTIGVQMDASDVTYSEMTYYPTIFDPATGWTDTIVENSIPAPVVDVTVLSSNVFTMTFKMDTTGGGSIQPGIYLPSVGKVGGISHITGEIYYGYTTSSQKTVPINAYLRDTIVPISTWYGPNATLLTYTVTLTYVNVSALPADIVPVGGTPTYTVKGTNIRWKNASDTYTDEYKYYDATCQFATNTTSNKDVATNIVPVIRGGTGTSAPVHATSGIFTANSDNATKRSEQAAVWGKVATVNICIRLKTALSTGSGNISNITAGTLAEGYRPAYNTSVIIPEVGGAVNINANGSVNIGSFLPNLTIATTTDLYIRGTYILA